MLNVGGGELIVVALIALIALGPEQLPTVMRKLGAFSAQLRSVTSGLRDEFLSGLDQPSSTQRQPPRTTFDPDRPIVPRGYAEQRRARLEADGDADFDGAGDGDGSEAGRDVPADTDGQRQPAHDPDSTP